MNDTALVAELSDRIRRIENEIISIRHVLEHQAPTDAIIPKTSEEIKWADKGALRERMERVRQALAIDGEPRGVEWLQKQMAESQLEQNELSRAIVTAREV